MGGITTEGDETANVRYCTLADKHYFPGLVALVNSLRLMGHHEPISILDLGLTAKQRSVLGAECDIIPLPGGHPRHPWLCEPIACMALPAEVIVYLDADVIVTRPLDALIERARAGKIVACADTMSDRWFSEWESIFELSRPLRHETYVNVGFLALSAKRFGSLLDRWSECCALLVGRPTVLDDRAAADTPVGFSSQDALNALLMSELAPSDLDIQTSHTEVRTASLPDTEVTDVAALTCTFEGQPVTFLHHTGRRKPWDRNPRALVPNAYLTCLRRLLTADDVALQPSPDEVPVWLRAGRCGALSYRTLLAIIPASRALFRYGRVLREATRIRSAS